VELLRVGMASETTQVMSQNLVAMLASWPSGVSVPSMAVCEVGAQSVVEAVTPVQRESAVFSNNKRLAVRASEPAQVDIHEDAPVMHLLKSGQHLPARHFTLIQIRRITRRAKGYVWQSHGQHTGTLYRIMPNGDRRQVPHPRERVALVQMAHAASGHLGLRRTTHLLLMHYWWQGIMKQVQQHVASCGVCVRARTTFNMNPGLALQPLPVSGMFHTWGVDTSGPLPKTERGNRYVLHAVEHFSGLMVLEPMPSKEASSTAYTFKHAVLERFGACAQVITDNGTEYQGGFHEMLCHAFIDHRIISTYHPQTNGLAERSVQTMKRALRKVGDGTKQRDWDEQLPYITLAYNCSRQEATRCAPYVLVYAREPVFPSR